MIKKPKVKKTKKKMTVQQQKQKRKVLYNSSTVRKLSTQTTIITPDINKITFTYRDENGRVVKSQTDKEILTRGAWSTILFKYKEVEPLTDDFGDEKAVIARYRKRGGAWKLTKAFRVTNAKMARKIARVFTEWFFDSSVDEDE